MKDFENYESVLFSPVLESLPSKVRLCQKPYLYHKRRRELLYLYQRLRLSFLKVCEKFSMWMVVSEMSGFSQLSVNISTS